MPLPVSLTALSQGREVHTLPENTCCKLQPATCAEIQCMGLAYVPKTNACICHICTNAMHASITLAEILCMTESRRRRCTSVR
jgi:hypothetical protein